MGLAVGTGRDLRAPPKAKRPRGVVFYRLLSAATVSRNQEAGMAISPCAAGLCSCNSHFRYLGSILRSRSSDQGSSHMPPLPYCSALGSPG